MTGINKTRELLYSLVCVLARDNANLFTRLDKTSALKLKELEMGGPGSNYSVAEYLNALQVVTTQD